MSIEVMQQALDALEFYYDQHGEEKDGQAITALRQAIEQAEQAQPVAWISHSDSLLSWDKFYDHMEPLYTAPPQRKPLPPQSPCEMTPAERKMFRLGWLECEAAHGIKE